MPSYGRGDDLRARLRADGPSIAEIVRSMVTGRAIEGWSLLSSGASGALPEYEVLGIVEQALQQSVIFDAGARVIPMNAPSVKLARVTSTPAVQIAPEADDRDLDDVAPAFTTESMDACSAFLYCTTSLESVEDVVNLEETIVNIFAGQAARAFDRYALGGDGNDVPLGLGYMFAADGVSEVDATGAPLAGYGKFIEAIGRVRARHHKPNAVVMDVPTWATLAMLTDQTDQPLVPPKAYSELAEHVSDFMPLDPGGTSSAAVGDFTRLLVGVRTGLQIEVDRMGAGFKAGKLAIRAFLRFGAFTDDPTAFAIIRGLPATALADDES
jgi:HK97 family phage major capsid protein